MGIKEILEHIEKYSNDSKKDNSENEINNDQLTESEEPTLLSFFNFEPEEERNKKKYDLFHYLISKSNVIDLDFLSSLNEISDLLKQNKIIDEQKIKLTKELVDLCNELNIQDFNEFNTKILSGKDKFAKFFVHQTKIHSDHFDAKKEALTLSTVHSAKGLEWKYVFIPGMSNEVFPGYKKNENEERKLFYVAASRTKEKLFLTRPKQVSVREYTFNKSRSPFILEDSTYLTYQN